MSAQEQGSDALNVLGFGDEAIAAIIVFVLGIIFTIIWGKLQKDRYRLSYEVAHQEISVDAPPDVKEKIRLFYAENEVSSLHSYNVTIRNSGNKSVQDQTVRFDFPPETDLLTDPDLQHEPLIGPVKLLSRTDSPLVLTYSIGQLPKGSAIQFRVLTCNNREALVKVSGRNDSNPDTEFLEKEASRQSTSKERLTELVLIVFAFQLVNLVPSSILFLPIKTGILLGLVLVAMPITLRLVRDFHDRLFSHTSQSNQTNIMAYDSARVSYVEKATQVSITKEEP